MNTDVKKSAQPLSRDDLAWAAGIFEGEGCISARQGSQKRKYDRGLALKIKMTDEDVLRTFHRIVRVGNVTGPYSAPQKKDA